MITETVKIKKLSERFNSFEELAKFVNNGRIIFEKSGRISYFKDDYKLKNDTDMYQTDYGYKFEKDRELSRRNVSRTKVFVKNTKVRLTYDPHYYYFSYSVLKNDGTNGEYKSNNNTNWSPDEFKKELEDCKKLFPKKHPEFNSINDFYAWVKNGEIKLSN